MQPSDYIPIRYTLLKEGGRGRLVEPGYLLVIIVPGGFLLLLTRFRPYHDTSLLIRDLWIPSD